MAGKIDPAVAASVAEAVRSVERSSSAELVVEVRTRSGSYADANARFGALVAFIVLLVVLFSPWNFPPLLVPLVVASTYIAGIYISRLTTPLQRLMTTRKERDRKVRA